MRPGHRLVALWLNWARPPQEQARVKEAFGRVSILPAARQTPPIEKSAGSSPVKSAPARPPAPNAGRSTSTFAIEKLRADNGASLSERSGIFISYSHRDQKWLGELKTMLSPLIRDGSLQVWDDTQIKTGAVWKEEIEKELTSAKVAVLLVSANFLASDFIAKNELPPLLAAARDNGLKICWIYVSSALYEHTEIAKYQAAHDVKRPLDRMPRDERQAALSKIAFEIRQLVG